MSEAESRGIDSWPEVWDDPNRPNSGERTAMIASAIQQLDFARMGVGRARTAVEPSGMRCALSRKTNYNYQQALHKADEGIRVAVDELQAVLLALVPKRCRPNDPPKAHLGPWALNAKEDTMRCESCGAVYDRD